MDSRTAATVNRTTAIVNQSGLRLAPSKQDSFQSVARCVVETTVLLPSCQQARSASWQCRRSLAKSVSDETSYFTGLTVSRDTAWNEGDSTECRLHDAKALHIHRHACSAAPTIRPRATSCHGEQIQTRAPRQATRTQQRQQ